MLSLWLSPCCKDDVQPPDDHFFCTSWTLATQLQAAATSRRVLCVGSHQCPYHARTARSRSRHTHPLVFVTAAFHMRAGPTVSAIFWASPPSPGTRPCTAQAAAAPTVYRCCARHAGAQRATLRQLRQALQVRRSRCCISAAQQQPTTQAGWGCRDTLGAHRAQLLAAARRIVALGRPVPGPCGAARALARSLARSLGPRARSLVRTSRSLSWARSLNLFYKAGLLSGGVAATSTKGRGCQGGLPGGCCNLPYKAGVAVGGGVAATSAEGRGCCQGGNLS